MKYHSFMHRLKAPAKLSTLSIIAATLSACGGGNGAAGDPPLEPYDSFFSPLPVVAHYPADNPFSQAKADLGEMLFWDPVLSGEQNVACASCHHPAFGWADGIPLSIGVDGEGLGPDRRGEASTPVNAPTIMNVAYTGLTNDTDWLSFVSGPYFFDLRAQTLEQQAIGPIKNQTEMRGPNYSEQEIIDVVVNRLQGIPEYVQMFTAAFGDEQAINQDNIAKALATFQRGINSPNSRFDSFLEGDESALTEQEIVGLNKFINQGCARCHSGPMLSDNLIHEDQPVVRGKEAVRTSSLRNISQTAPYMHDGSRQTLRNAIAIYEERGDLQVSMDDGDIGDIERFLRTLDDDSVSQRIPEYVPSGLPVGGDID